MLTDALKCLTLDELGQAFSIGQASFLAPFDHFYNDNVFSDALNGDISYKFGANYVALAYVLTLDTALEKLPMDI